MDNNYNHQEFEEFLQDQLKNHRMYPHDASWLNIKKRLHEEKKWPALTIAAFAIFSLSIVICIYFTPKPNIFTYKELAQNSLQKGNLFQKNSVSTTTTSNLFTTIDNAKGENNNTHTKNYSVDVNDKSVDDNIVANNKLNKQSISAELESKIYNSLSLENNNNNTAEYTATANRKEVNDTINETSLASNAASINLKNPFENISKVFSEKIYKTENNSETKLTLIQKFQANKRVKKGSNKLALQLYIAPSVSYRILKEEKHEKENIDGPVALNYVADVNNVVRHKPGTGIEAGVSFLYNMTKTIRLKSGLQFNMRQYSIEAYRSNNEVASIALVNGNQLDTVNSIAMYRISNGFYSTDLVNRYFQVSIPVGIEWQIAGNKKIQWNIAGTIQPTYLLNKDAYLISTNFKNYTESPDVIRRWNINSNIETFISFKSGGFKWQLGPQVRYQPNSTFISQYPIKEYLLDYGLKFGISTGL